MPYKIKILNRQKSAYLCTSVIFEIFKIKGNLIALTDGWIFPIVGFSTS